MALPVLPHTLATPTDFVGVASNRLSRSGANLAAAHWLVETAGGKSMYGWNPGNLTCGAAPGATCGTNPLVTAPLNFAMFSSLFGGSEAYFTFIKAHGGWDQLAAGNVVGYASALAAMGYAGAGMPASTYQAQLQAWLPKAQAVVLPPADTGSPVGTVAAVAALGIVGMFLGSWAAEGFKRTPILASLREARRR